MRAIAYYIFTAVITVIYGAKICPLMAGLPTWKLALIVGVPLAAAFAARTLVIQPAIAARRPRVRSRLQFRTELGLFLGSGLCGGLYTALHLGFPYLHSGLKLLVGFATLGLFAAIDLALERERGVIHDALNRRIHLRPPHSLSPMTTMFAVLGSTVLLLVTAIIMLVVGSDIHWIVSDALVAAKDGGNMALRSVILDISYVMAVLLALLINLILSYARNLKLLFQNQTTALEQVSRGDLDAFVPAVTTDEFGYIAGHTNQMIESLRDRMRLLRGVAVAREVQFGLLPASSPLVPGHQVAGMSLYSDETGGDYYDFIDCSAEGGCIEIAVGDVTGHGIGAALLMAEVRALLRARSRRPATVARIASDVNGEFAHDTFGTGRFVTLFLMRLEDSGALRWVNAGHEPPLLLLPEREEPEQLRGEDIPLGVLQDWQFQEFGRPPLPRGSVLLIGTDGLTESRDARGELFGRQRIVEVMRANAKRDAQDILDALVAAEAAFRGEVPQQDDLTMVVVKAVG